jgi:hypothetical protein
MRSQQMIKTNRTILHITVFFLAIFGLIQSARAQSETTCPKIEIAPPRTQGKYFGRGETYLMGAIVNPPDDLELQFRWELSPNLPYTEVDTAMIIPAKKGIQYISFVATPNLQSTTIKAEVTVDGLPAQCGNYATTTFKVEYDPETPRVIGKFSRSISADLREVNLFTSTDALKNADDTIIALFVVDYSKTDKKRTLRKYIEEVSDTLVNQLKFPQNKFAFAFRQKDDKTVTVYGWPTEKNHSWETDIDRLEIPD